MKAETEIEIKTTPEKIWTALTDFPRYPEWNRFLRKVEGEGGPDRELKVELQFRGEDPRALQAKITGWVPGKYLSWTWSRGPWWWYNVEHVLRMREKEPGRTRFYQEMYFTGLRMRAMTGNLDRIASVSMGNMNDALKELVEGPAPA